MTNSTRALAALVLMTLMGCASVVPLPTVAGDGNVCRGVGINDGILRGDPRDARVAWVDAHGPQGEAVRVEVVFPSGYAAQFTPALVVLDAKGHGVATAGDPITGGCVTGPDASGPLLILGVGSSDIRRR